MSFTAAVDVDRFASHHATMPDATSLAPDVVIFGGGVMGLWLLDDLINAGYSAILLEKHALGAGQTVASQGIIHGGLKYTLSGKPTQSATAVKELPHVWRRCLEGNRRPDIRATPMRSSYCHLWSTDSLRSKLGMFGASHALAVKPVSLPRDEWPTVLRDIRGSVQTLDEQVISPPGLIAAMAAPHWDRILKVGNDCGVTFVRNDNERLSIQMHKQSKSKRLTFTPKNIVFAAGEGNAALREQVNLSAQAMQRRPVQMILARGDLPELNGHCVDGNRTRVTITTDRDSAGRTIWQIGGQVSEDSVAMTGEALIAYTKKELEAILPNIDLQGIEWATYRVNKAEGTQKGGKRPATEVILHEGNVTTVWPTKLVLAPSASQGVMQALTEPSDEPMDMRSLVDWTPPKVAMPPWETATWT